MPTSLLTWIINSYAAHSLATQCLQRFSGCLLVCLFVCFWQTRVFYKIFNTLVTGRKDKRRISFRAHLVLRQVYSYFVAFYSTVSSSFVFLIHIPEVCSKVLDTDTDLTYISKIYFCLPPVNILDRCCSPVLRLKKDFPQKNRGRHGRKNNLHIRYS